MLARIVRLSLLLELAAYAALELWLLAVPIALAARLALVCVTLSLGWIARSPREAAHRIGLAGTVGLVLGEWRTLVLDNCFYLPFERQALRRDPEPDAAGAMPILLAHGYFTNRGYFRPLVHALEARGVAALFTPNFSAAFAPIDRYVDELHREIERIASAGGAGRVILVCHSMGGLAAREYLRRHGSARIARLVTIASPHHGTVMARLGVGANSAQMRPGSEFLALLEAHEREHPPAIAAVSIYSPHDNLVAPQATSRLPWARNVALPGLGHIAILGSARLFAAVLDEIAAARAARD